MLINHLDLQVHDVQASARFFERNFGFALQTSRTSPALAVLGGDGGFVLVLQRRRDEAPYPDGFHLGFLVDEVARVHELHARLTADDGCTVSPVERNARGTMIYCRHDGVVIEVSCRGRG